MDASRSRPGALPGRKETSRRTGYGSSSPGGGRSPRPARSPDTGRPGRRSSRHRRIPASWTPRRRNPPAEHIPFPYRSPALPDTGRSMSIPSPPGRISRRWARPKAGRPKGRKRHGIRSCTSPRWPSGTRWAGGRGRSGTDGPAWKGPCPGPGRDASAAGADAPPGRCPTAKRPYSRPSPRSGGRPRPGPGRHRPRRCTRTD